MYKSYLTIFYALISPVYSISTAPSKSLTTASGLKVSSYGLGGAARSTQPSSLPSLYFEEITKRTEAAVHERVAPFYFYYNPHRYPQFMSGVKDICNSNTKSRDDIFVAGGGTDRGIDALEQRLSDCLKYCGGTYLDAFFIEYVVPSELVYDEHSQSNVKKPGDELSVALKHSQQWLENGSVRYVGISTHSHEVGAILANCPEVDILMLRFGMSHKHAAENISLPAAEHNGKPVIAFTTTRWNSLQDGIDNDKNQWPQGDAPSSSTCLSFAFGARTSPPIEAVLHSARNEDELLESMAGLRYLSEAEDEKWRKYGEIFEHANADNFDEYPKERYY